MKTRLRKGFTLIEIIIVIVIIGVLATLALPRITGQIEASRGAEAMQMFGAMRRAVMNCIDMASDGTVASTTAAAANCANSWTNMGMTAPTGAVFTYNQTNGATVQFRAVRGANSICANIVSNTGATTYSLAPATSANPYWGAAQRTGSYNAVPACAAAVVIAP